MRTRIAVTAASCLAIASVALAQRPAPSVRPVPVNPASATATHAGATGADAGTTATYGAPMAAMMATDAGAPGSADAASGPDRAPRTFDLPMVQRGTGAMTHYPLPEQLARNDVPVFVQVRTSAPIDHVSMFYRTRGATRYREVRMETMGQDVSLPGGYGAQVPCDDAFPPMLEYYVSAIDTSGASVGAAGSSAQPIALPIVTQRTFQIVPTLPGRPAPRNCGSLSAPPPIAATPGLHRGADGGVAAPVEVIGTADLGEPCAHNNDCRHGLRCGTNHRCVFIRQP